MFDGSVKQRRGTFHLTKKSHATAKTEPEKFVFSKSEKLSPTSRRLLKSRPLKSSFSYLALHRLHMFAR